ncbi:transporter substrate-binding domain-containing protein [Rhodoferax sp. U11-2br]|uniref:transporter substrate-binding domain-containing protein n=1 Tax=Rhodoferax sp. U11-2br TaxID=2838878 RepID=UPI001BEABA81|nr:transporter substrate-binding domain-containing protein [Rhodoferax sp. U11-2br]MBT3065596.1 transporter substrate-binding domain-containing protein [Rhodoferax sp. U11-2br]
MRLPAILTALLASLITFTSVSANADQLADIKKKGEIVFGVLGIDEPNSFVDPKTREFIGYEIDLATDVAKALGVKPVFKQLAVAARIPELQQGHVDVLAASLTHNKERESQVDFALTHFVTGSKVLVKKSSGIKNVSELAGKKALTVKGGTQGPNLLKVVPTAEIVTFESTQQAFQALQQGKGTAYINDEVSLLADFAKLGDKSKDYQILPQNLNVEPLAFGIKKGETAVKAAVDDALRGLEKSGEANKVFLKWYGPDSKLKLFPKRDFKIDSDKIEG